MLTFDEKNQIWEKFPILETPRLILRQMTNRDVQDLFGFFGDPDVCRYTDFDPFDTPEQVKTLVSMIEKRFATRTGIRWGIELKSEQKIIGSIGFNSWITGHANKAMLGYDLATTYWRQGIMTEAIQKILEYGFDTMQLHRIEALINPKNIGSQRVIEKSGFRKEGIQRGIGYWKGQYWDLLIYARLKTDIPFNL